MSTKTGQKSEEISKGAQWIIDRIDSMQNDYRDALMAAVTILQYQNQSRKLRTGRKDVPRYMSKRLDDAWARYEATRRHVEWYMKQNALYASSPSHPAIIMPTPQPVIPDSSRLAPTPQEQPKASPIPLSTASLLAYDNNQVSQLPNSAVSLPINDLSKQPDLSLNTMGFNANAIDLTGDTSMDFSSIGINELQNLINSTSTFYPSQSSEMPSAPLNTNTDFAMFTGGDKGMMGGMTPNTQAETDKILASLGAGSTQNGSASIQQSNQPDMAALLASLGGNGQSASSGTGQTTDGLASAGALGQTGFDFNFGHGGDGDVDLSDLVGLFSDNGTGQAGNSQGQTQPAQPMQVGQPQINSQSQPPGAQIQPQPPTQNTQDGGQQQANSVAGSVSAPQSQGQQTQQSATSAQKPPPSNLQQPASSQTNASQASQQTQQAQQAEQPQTTQQNAFGSDFNMANLASSDFQLDGTANTTNNDAVGLPGDAGDGDAYGAEQINLDDFNFGDDGMPSVDDGMFESMFAEFK